jgi:hypothetical protein
MLPGGQERIRSAAWPEVTLGVRFLDVRPPVGGTCEVVLVRDSRVADPPHALEHDLR